MNLSRCTYILFSVFVIILSVSCEDENYFDNLFDPEDMVDPHSFHYDKHKKMMVDIVENIENSDESTKKYNEIKKECKYEKQVYNCESHEAVFYKRLINILLLNMNVKEETDTLTVGTLEFEIPHAQMKMLQNFDGKTVSLKEVDEIFSTTVKKPFYNMYSVTESFTGLFEKFVMIVRAIQDYPDIAMLVSLILIFSLMLRMIKLGRGFPMFIIMQIIFVSSFIMTWWHLLQEAEIKSITDQMKYSNVPLSCQPHKMSTWDKLLSYINSNDDCEKYHQAMMSNPKLKVTPAHALSHLLTTVILDPVVHMGTIVSGFIDNATSELSCLYGWIVRCMLFFGVTVVIILLPICLSGASINLGVGPLLRFGIGYHRNDRKGNSLDYENKREPVQDIPPQMQAVTAPVETEMQTNAVASRVEQLKQIELSETKVQNETDLKESDTKKETKVLTSSDSRKIIECLESNTEERKCDNVSENVSTKHGGSGDA